MLNEFLGRATVKVGGWRADPVPLGLIGLGIGWFVAENLGLFDSAIPGLGEHASSSGGTSTAPPGTQTFMDHADSNSDGWLHQAVNATQGALREAKDRSSAMLGQATDLLAHPADSRQKTMETIGGSPLLLGLAGIAAGTIMAMLLPASRAEREIASQAREGIWETAEEIGQRAANTVHDMAEDLKEGFKQDQSDSGQSDSQKEQQQAVKPGGTVGRDVPDESKEHQTEIAVAVGHRDGGRRGGKR
jgi:hypothetical protein